MEELDVSVFFRDVVSLNVVYIGRMYDFVGK